MPKIALPPDRHRNLSFSAGQQQRKTSWAGDAILCVRVCVCAFVWRRRGGARGLPQCSWVGAICYPFSMFIHAHSHAYTRAHTQTQHARASAQMYTPVRAHDRAFVHIQAHAAPCKDIHRCTSSKKTYRSGKHLAENGNSDTGHAGCQQQHRTRVWSAWARRLIGLPPHCSLSYCIIHP